MLLPNIILIVLLNILFQHSQGEKVMISSKGRREAISCTIAVAEDAGKKEHDSCDDSCKCCIFNVTCVYSLYSALQKANGSSNVIINITTDVVLSSVVQLMNINNITIVGHNNPAVKCNNTGALNFTSSHDITMQGMKWEECGNNYSYTSPSLSMYDCSGVNIINCSFNSNTTQSILLNDVSGIVTINNCHFMANNSIYDGHGAAIYYSSMKGKGVFAVNNSAFLYYRAKSVVYINGKSGYETFLSFKNLTFSLNQAVPLCVMKSTVNISGNLLFEGNYNQAQNGGGICASDHATIHFDDTSNVTFSNNTANKGSAVYINNNASVIFEGKCSITENSAEDGTFYAGNSSSISFIEQSEVNFTNNNATQGGAIYLHDESNLIITCKENCQVLFKGNEADVGGAIYHRNSNITFTGCPNITFIDNNATFQGGAIYSHFNSYVKIQEHSFVQFFMNAADFGGAMHATTSSHVVVQDNPMVRFFNNKAFSFGGAICLYGTSDVIFKGNHNITFGHNQAAAGGALCIHYNCLVDFSETCEVLFNNNFASFGGAIFVSWKSNVTFRGDSSSNITFIKNQGNFGGAFYSSHSSTIAFNNRSSIEFRQNSGRFGGVLYSRHSYVVLNGACKVKFIENTADEGGVIYAYESVMISAENSSSVFEKNRAYMDGGVMYLSNGSSVAFNDQCNSTLFSNTASDYGGVIYVDSKSKIVINTTNIVFSKNTAAAIDNTFYINVQDNFSNTCLTNCIMDINHNHSQQNYSIATSPNRLELHDPARCIHNKDNCDQYYIKDIMFGQEIIINGCVFDYYNQSSEAARLLDISSDTKDYYIHGSDNVLISCNHTFQGISVSGNVNAFNALPSNIIVKLTLHFDRRSESNSISVILRVELSPCHPGFIYNSSSHMCQCYNTGDVVFCSDSNSTIRRGYWFGTVNEKSTVAHCPINYCNFTCCETTNGIYHLSPIRKHQCALHRDGTACGDCEEGYTLSFDSAMCIEVENCTAGYTALIIILTILYWMVVIVVTFFLMHYQVAIGYLYVIIYYYSVLDLLLSYLNVLYISGELNMMVNIMSSIAKLLPQFLGQLCLVEDMDEIDQQFIHYIHPLAISFILVIVSCLAKCSYRVSSFISKDIIRVICLLILLSYTSVVITSLLILQPLRFLDVDEIYSYLSPDIQYFQGRHLAYGLVAILCTIVIVIGLPLLLTLEPFLNSKISFVKIKPFLDQFQGCYKDKYRCFAGYYMICRVMIITIIIIQSSTDNYGRYLLIILCTITALIHLIVRPYASNVLNIFDGVILQLMVFVVAGFDFDDHFSNSLIGIVYIIVIMPMTLFCIMESFVYRVKIKKIVFTICAVICKGRKRTFNISKTDVSNNDIDLTIGNTFRRSRGTTICEM